VTRRPAMVWIATGLMEGLTGIERIVLNTVAAFSSISSADNVILVDLGATWTDPLESYGCVMRLPRAKGGIARRAVMPNLARDATRIVTHSFGGRFPSGLPPASHKSYTVHDWSPFHDQAMPAAARLAWGYAISAGVRSARLLHFYSQSMVSESPPVLRHVVRRRAIVTGLPYPGRRSPQPERADRHLPRTPGLVLSVGTNIPRKRFGLVANACEHLDGVQFVAAGDGTEKLAGVESHTGARASLGLGRVTEVELENLYATAALVVLASSYEGFGLPVLEAWEAGCPILITEGVATRLPYEVAESATVVPTDVSAEQLSTAIAGALAQPEGIRRNRPAEGPTLIDYLQRRVTEDST
jgi:glycosyltransferase involved in cell wall biosynthesis